MQEMEDAMQKRKALKISQLPSAARLGTTFSIAPLHPTQAFPYPKRSKEDTSLHAEDAS